ncbi:hypothetical protein ACFW2X_06590 [Streptomyces antibioticus]|uniref:hypothetical protein n=1 Tax=Streptomyces antibioticus TaxID=1890 RepID=UPI00368048E1
MTGPEHYCEAEAHLASAARDFLRGEDTSSALAAAQVHATLALAAATAMQAPVDGAEPGMSSPEYAAWYEAAGVKPATIDQQNRGTCCDCPHEMEN